MFDDLFGPPKRRRKKNDDPLGLGGFSIGPENKPKKRRKIDKPTRDAVWLKYMGNKAEGKCYCCKIRTIHITNFQVGHNKAVAKGGNDNVSNLRPICGPCNRGMGTMSIESYRKKYYQKPTKKTTKKKTTKKKKSTSSENSFDISGGLFGSHPPQKRGRGPFDF